METYITETIILNGEHSFYRWQGDDIAHAIEQCDNAYPEEKIIGVWLACSPGPSGACAGGRCSVDS